MVKTYFKDGMKMTGNEWNEKIKPLIDNGTLKDVNKEWGNRGCMMIYQALSCYVKDIDGKVYHCSAWNPPGQKEGGLVNIELRKNTPQEQRAFDDDKYVNEKLALLAEGKLKSVSFNFGYSDIVKLLEKHTVSFTMLGTRYYIYHKQVYSAENDSLHFVNPLNIFVAELETVVRTLDNLETQL